MKFLNRVWAPLRRSIRLQLVVGFGFSALVLLLGFGYLLLNQQRVFLNQFGEERAKSLAYALSIGSNSWALSNDLVGLQEVVQGFAQTPDLQRAYFVNMRGEVLASTKPNEIGFFVTDPLSRQMLASAARDTLMLAKQNDLISVAHPVIAGGKRLGWLRVEMTRDSTNENLSALGSTWIKFVLFAILAISVVAIEVARRLTLGLNHLMRVAAEVEHGRERLRSDIGREDEIGVLARHLDRMLDALEKQEQKIRSLAFYDTLTKLPNRRLLLDRLGQVMSASKRSARYAALMFLDLDNFKPLNDVHGHDTGDMLLIEVAFRISACIREMDTVARFGGDEFVVVMSELTFDLESSRHQASLVAEKIRAAIAEPFMLAVPGESEADKASIEHHCTSSIGIVLFLNHEASQDEIIKWADQAMYQAKAAGRNQFHFYAR